MRVTKQPLKRTTALSIICASFMMGLVLPRLYGKLTGDWLLILIFLISTGAVLRKVKFISILICLFLGLLVGWARGYSFFHEIKKYDNFENKTITVEGKVLEDAVYNERGQLAFSIGNLRIINDNYGNLPGEIDVDGFGVPMVYRSDRIRAEGRFYKKRGAQLGGISFADISKIKSSPTPIDMFRQNFAAGTLNVLPEPLGSFSMGLLIGQRSTLGEKLTEELTAVGLIHIVAVSGYNLTVIISFLQKRLKNGSRLQALLLSLTFITVFILITGFSASIVRAGVVSTLGLMAWYYGRKFKPILLILLVASSTAAVNPLYIWSNIGWYLSFTAFFGVLVIAPLIQDVIYKKQKQPSLLVGILIETTCAQLSTLPIILYIFGRLSVVSIIANLLVVPLVPLAMLGGLLAGLVGIFQIASLKTLIIPARMLLQYMLDISSLLSRVPYANVELNISAQTMALLYLVIVSMCVLLWSGSKKYETITDVKHYGRSQ